MRLLDKAIVSSLQSCVRNPGRVSTWVGTTDVTTGLRRGRRDEVRDHALFSLSSAQSMAGPTPQFPQDVANYMWKVDCTYLTWLGGEQRLDPSQPTLRHRLS